MTGFYYATDGGVGLDHESIERGVKTARGVRARLAGRPGVWRAWYCADTIALYRLDLVNNPPSVTTGRSNL